MNWTLFAVTGLATLFQAFLFQIIPMAQGSFLFTVRVPDGFAASEEGLRLVRQFRALAWTAALAGVSLMYWAFTENRLGLGATIPVVTAFVTTGLMFWARQRTLRHAAPAGGHVRRATLVVSDEPADPWWVLMAPAIGWALFLAAVLLLIAWADQVPDPMPVHYGIDGRPDRWQSKSLPTLFHLPAVGASTLAMLSFVLWAVRQSGPPTYRRRMNLMILGVMNISFGVLFGVISLSPARGALGLPAGPWMIIAALLPVVPILWMSVKLQSADTGGDDEPTRDECWRAGFIYSDPADSRMMVPNRIGAGYGFNMGHPVVRIVFPAMLVLIMGLSFAPLLLR